MDLTLAQDALFNRLIRDLLDHLESVVTGFTLIFINRHNSHLLFHRLYRKTIATASLLPYAYRLTPVRPSRTQKNKLRILQCQGDEPIGSGRQRPATVCAQAGEKDFA